MYHEVELTGYGDAVTLTLPTGVEVTIRRGQIRPGRDGEPKAFLALAAPRTVPVVRAELLQPQGVR